MTGPLDNARHERFAQERARGKTADEAYVLAGFKANRGNAARLNANESIQARVRDIQGRVAKRTEVTVAGITERLLRIADVSEQSGVVVDEVTGKVKSSSPKHLAVMRNALMDAAKLNGLVVEKHDLRSSDGSMTPKEPTYKLVK
jgi:phage terminase small subunit